MTGTAIHLREVRAGDLDDLVRLEADAFRTDRFSRRSFRHWIGGGRRAFLAAMVDDTLAGYVLVIYHRGTRLARLYSKVSLSIISWSVVW